MEELRSLINQRKSQNDSIKSKKHKKYMRRGEIEKIVKRDSKRRKLVENDESSNATSNEKAIENEDITTTTATPTTTTTTTTTTATDTATIPAPNNNLNSKLLPLSEVIGKLRSFLMPITLFGESNAERQLRMTTAMGEQAEASVYELEEGHDTRNVFLAQSKKQRAEEVQDDNDDEDDDDHDNNKEKGNKEKKSKTTSTTTTAASTTTTTTNGADDAIVKDKIEVMNDGLYCYRYFKKLLKEWSEDLSSRPENITHTLKGRKASNTYKQCKDYIRPFLKLCKKNTVPVDIMKQVHAMVINCEAQQYVKANEYYLQLSIGNKPWPIGVTSVGIHMRTGREKIQINKTTHVMNNEQQRKYITNIKRLMTYAQTKYPTDPSRMMFS